MKYLVSVCMITYNHEKYIAQAIDSILMQKINFELEIIIGEDFSKDRTREIVLDYKARYPNRIKLLLQEKNAGMMQNFIDTIKVCTGKYIALLEGDDYWTDPYKLQKQVDLLENNPDYSLVHTDADIYYTKSNTMVKGFYGNLNMMTTSDKVFENILISNYPVFTCTVVFRKNLLKSINFKDIAKFLSGDTFLWLEFSRISKFKYISESTSVHQLLEESATQSNNLEKLILFRQAGYDLFKYFIMKYPVSKEIQKKIHANSNRVILSIAFQSGNRSLIRESYNKVIKLSGFNYLNIRDHLHYLISINPFVFSVYKYLKYENNK